MDNGQKITVLHLQPVGCQRLPRNAAELRRALLCVLEALASMHENKIVHRDVRWPNIILLLDKSWRLIDLEFAAEMKKGGAPWPYWTRGVPMRPMYDSCWTNAQDVTQVARLVFEVPCLGEDDMKHVHDVLESCTSAQQALQAMKKPDIVAVLPTQ